jgi:hypothetical protein
MCVKKWLTALARAVPAGALSYLRKAPAGGRQEGKPPAVSYRGVNFDEVKKGEDEAA